MSFNITPVASGYQEIHPYSAMNIDSVKINTSLIMMKECIVLCKSSLGSETRMYFGPMNIVWGSHKTSDKTAQRGWNWNVTNSAGGMNEKPCDDERKKLFQREMTLDKVSVANCITHKVVSWWGRGRNFLRFLLLYDIDQCGMVGVLENCVWYFVAE